MDYTTHSPSYQKGCILTLPRQIRTHHFSMKSILALVERLSKVEVSWIMQNCAYILDALPWYCNVCNLTVCPTGITLLCMDPEFAGAWRPDLKDVCTPATSLAFWGGSTLDSIIRYLDSVADKNEHKKENFHKIWKFPQLVCLSVQMLWDVSETTEDKAH